MNLRPDEGMKVVVSGSRRELESIEEMKTKAFFLLIGMAGVLALAGALAQAGDYPLQAVPFSAVQVQSAFWSPRLETNRTVTIGHNLSMERCRGLMALSERGNSAP